MAEQQQFFGKVIAITGAASGIGLATAHLLASRGADLSLADVQKGGLTETKDDLAAKYPERTIRIFPLDVQQYDQVEKWMSETRQHFGRLDGAANLAGIVPKSAGINGVQDQSLDEWGSVLGVNLTGVMHCLKAQLNVLSPGSAVVNAASIAGLQGRAKNAAYTASKHGVIGLTKSAAKEVGVADIRVNAICPGRIETPMLNTMTSRAASKGEAEEMDRETKIDVSLRRIGRPEEVAKLVAFLLSHESSYISGASVGIDGGWNC